MITMRTCACGARWGLLCIVLRACVRARVRVRRSPPFPSYSLFCFGWGAAEKGNGVVGWGEVAHPTVQSLLDGAGFGVLVLRLVGFQLIPRLLCDDFEDSLLVGWQRFSLVPQEFWIV